MFINSITYVVYFYFFLICLSQFNHNFSVDNFGFGVSVLPVTLFVCVLCKCTLIIHVECTSILVMMVLFYTLFL